MKPFISHVLTVALLATAPIACGDKAEKDDSAKKDKDDKKKKKGGIDAKDNDEDVVKLAKKVLDCEWKKGSPPSTNDCEPYKEWTKGDSFKDGKVDETLVNFVEDEEPNVRYLGAYALSSRGKDFREDKKLAKRVVKALEDEKEEKPAERLASAVADIDLEKTGLIDDAISIVKDHKIMRARSRLVGDVMFNNRDSKKMYEFVKEMAKSGDDEEIRSSAVSGFWTGTPRDKKDEVCTLWREVAETDKADKVAEKAFRLAFQNPSKGCENEYDNLLKIGEKEAKEGTAKTSDIGSGLGYLAGQKDVNPGRKSKALAAAKALLANDKNEGMARSAALRTLGRYDPSAKSLANKYKNDEEFFVKSTAKQILEGKIKPEK